MATNRDIYLAIMAFDERIQGSPRTLEEYLRAVLTLASPYQECSYLTTSEFLTILTDALDADPLPFDPRWKDGYNMETVSHNDFADWYATVRQQVIDLHDMAEAGTFANELRYFGVTAPRGSYWFNFDIGTFLECATAGCYGGWELGDSGGRIFVPGQVAVPQPDGSITPRNPQESKQPIIVVDRVTWGDFTRFMKYGQSYE